MFIILFSILIISPVEVYGESSLTDGISDSLSDCVPEGSEDFVSNYDINRISFDDIYHDIIDSIKDSISIPLELTFSLIVCIVITALMQSFSEIAKSQKVYEVICVLVCIRLVVQPISQLINSVQDVMLSNAMFINSYVPIFSSVMVASGQITTSASYGAITYISCQIWVQFADKIILPLMSVSLALSCINSICGEVSLGEIVKVIKKCVNWVMTISMIIFSGIVTIQGTVSNAGDKVTSKALKFVVSNGIPIVGNAVSDACETVRSSLGLVKSSVGLVGIVVILISVLPPIINVGIMRIVITLGETLADMFDIKCIKTFLSDVSAVLSATFSCAVCFAVTFIVSIGAVMLLVSG